MTLEKAIELLRLSRYQPPPKELPDLNDAIKLGIEALERLAFQRKVYARDQPHLLPSESEPESGTGR